MPLDIRPDHLKIVLEILNRVIPDREVWAFGSRVTGNATETSDLDMAVIGETPLEFETLAALRDAFSESRIPYKVDVVDWATISETFREIIRKDKVVLKEAGLNECSDRELSYPSVKLSEVATIIMGQSPPGSTYNEIGIGTPFYQGATDFGSRYPLTRVFCSAPTRMALRGNILLSVRAPIGRVNISTESCSVGRGLAIIRGNNSTDTTFLEFYLRSLKDQWDALESQGSVFGNAKKEDLEKLSVVWPEQEIRRAIAHILGTLDDKIELNRRMNETLEAMARAIFKSWFVDFDPVRAKAEGRDTGLPKEIADLFPDSFEDSELGEIPRGWGVTCVGEAFELNPSEKLSKGKVSPYLDMSAIPTQGSWPEVPISRAFVSGSKFRNGDTLFARITPCLENGKTAYIQCLGEEKIGWGSTEFIVIRPKAPFPKEFGYLLARDREFREHAIQSMSGTSGRQRVQLDSIAAFKLLRPERRVLESFGTIIQQWFSLIKINSENMISLNQIRDFFLPKLLSGEIRIADPSELLEQSL